MEINGPAHLDSENTTFAFSAVIGMSDGQDGDIFQIHVEVTNNGQPINYSSSMETYKSVSSECVWLDYNRSCHSQLKTDNLRVKFECKDLSYNPSKTVFFKSCGFHIEQRYEEKAIGLMDGVELSKRCRDDDGDGNLESNMYPQQKRDKR